jgi:vacuolar-type H+-ATPase subunit E/Vma4
MLLRRATPWPPDALRLFADSLGWRQLASELSNERRLTQTLRDIQARLSSEAQDIREQIGRMQGSVDEGRLRAIETALRKDLDTRIDELKRDARDDSELRAHLARLDRKVIELNRGIQAMSGRIEGILSSRTWRMLTTLGGIVLRLTGRKG